MVGYYRAQEFARWWPINVAELRTLQLAVVRGSRMTCGRITTITAEARSSGKSPTQEAMPVIDRWLGQYPERLYVLATPSSAQAATCRCGLWSYENGFRLLTT